MKKLIIKIKTFLFEKFTLKFLILIAIVVMLMTAAAVYFLMISGQKEPPPAVDYSSFAIGREQIKSIGEVVGTEREWSSMEFSVEGTTEMTKYVYSELTSGSADVKAYADYLKNECDFIPMMKFDPSNPAGYLSYGKKSIDDGYIMKIDIDYTNEDYTIYTSKSESTDIPASDPNVNDTTSKDDLLTYLSDYDYKILGLPKELSSYITIFDVGRTVINNTHCYGINVYEKSADGKSNLVVGKFYVPLSRDLVYKYDVQTESFTQIKKVYKEPEPVLESEAEEVPEEEVDTSNMTKEELAAKKKADKEAEKAAAKEAKELEKANKAAQKEQEKKLAASKKAAEAAEKEKKKAEKAMQKAKEAEEKAKQEQQKADEAAAEANSN